VANCRDFIGILASTSGLAIVTDEHITGWNAFEPTLSRIEQMEYADISGGVLHQSRLIGLSMMAKHCSTL